MKKKRNRPVNVYAMALSENVYRQRVVQSRRVYNRKRLSKI